MKVLLIGSGGREHALAWKLAQSPKLTKLYCAPGNAGIKDVATCLPFGTNDLDHITTFCIDNDIELVIVGPEEPLVLGLADKLKAAGIPVFGPSQAAAELEGSKGFMKDVLEKANVPTAAYGRFTDIEDAKAFIHKNGAPIVVKTDGLAAGKGVLICESVADAILAAEDMLSGVSFGNAGKEIVIEDYLDGEELSYFAICDGETVLPLTSAQDHKRAFDGDKGLNTGGMGAYSPAHMMTEELEHKILKTCLEPTLKTMKELGKPFTGVLFCGIMLCKGEPKVLEYNIRFGDPECQALMLRFEGDLLSLLEKAAKGQLKGAEQDFGWSVDPSICIVMAARGYPGDYQKGSVIKGLLQVKNATVFHAGTKSNDKDEVLSNGGRVLNICSRAKTVEACRDIAYEDIKHINWPEGFYRSDIGWRAVEKNERKAS